MEAISPQAVLPEKMTLSARPYSGRWPYGNTYTSAYCEENARLLIERLSRTFPEEYLYAVFLTTPSFPRARLPLFRQLAGKESMD